ncbi:MAG TPA: hypothetical protein VGG74_21125 [Kofleriaceae bacterium]
MTTREFVAIRRRVIRRLGWTPGEQSARSRFMCRVSNAVAAELRKRGEIDEEGYAPGSWAAPRER